MDSEIVCQCDGRYQSDQCNPTINQSHGTSNLNTPSDGMTLCEEGDLGYKIQLAAYKEANLGKLSMFKHHSFIGLFLDASTFDQMVAIAAAVCNVPEVCGRPCRDDSVINVPTNSVTSSSGMTLCEEGDLGYKIQLEAYKEANLGKLLMFEHHSLICLFS